MYNDLQFHVNTLGTTILENKAESTRLETQEHRYQCDKCIFNSSYMDELLMHVNTKHRGGGQDDAIERSYLNVSISEQLITVCARLSPTNCNVKNIKLFGDVFLAKCIEPLFSFI